MKTNVKLIRVAVAAFVGSVLWAGCAGPDYMVTDADTVSMAPIDQTRRRPDTHPELRSSLWQTSYQNYDTRGSIPAVVETTVVDGDETGIPVTSKDSTSLLVFNPSVVNIALGAEASPAIVPGTAIVGAPGTVVVEAAGAEPGAVRTSRSWAGRVLENKRRLDAMTAQ